MNFIKKIFGGSSSNEEVVSIASGSLFLSRSPNSPRGKDECIFSDATAIIRQTTVEYQYQLVIAKNEHSNLSESEVDEDEDDSSLDELKDDEWSFLLDESLKLHALTKEDGQLVIAWSDISGDPEDSFVYICSKSTKQTQFDAFIIAAYRCEYERKYRKPSDGVAIEDLQEFVYIPPVSVESIINSPVKSVNSRKEDTSSNILESPKDASGDTAEEYHDPTAANVTEQDVNEAVDEPEVPVLTEEETKDINEVIMDPSALDNGTVLTKQTTELHFFDLDTATFVIQESGAIAKVIDVGKWHYWLLLEKADGTKVLGAYISPSMNPNFNFEHLAFIFNFVENNIAVSYLLKFSDFSTITQFQEGYMIALWESLNKTKWIKATEQEKDYVLDAFDKMTLEDEEMEDAPELSDDDDEYYSGNEGDEETTSKTLKSGAGKPTIDEEDEDEDEEEAERRKYFSGKEKNSQLEVGYKNDRSYVVRGQNIGVFKHSEDNNLEYAGVISNVRGPKGNPFSPKKIMLHTGDRSMIVQDGKNDNSLFRMDLEYGKIVDEWQVGQDGANIVKEFGPTNKFAQMTDEQTFLGISSNSLYKIDPRLSGNKLVNSELKSYKTNNDFSALTTTENGYIAVASNKGDIRLYDRLGINAKTHLPALGEAIVGIDVSADGRWILATCSTYILLVDTLIKTGKNAGNLGFKKSFSKDAKPKPRRLQISPEHVALMMAETKKGLSFTKAHFNTGVNAKEQTIVTSSGPYVITWSMKKILKREPQPYLIKRYDNNVIADNFQFGTDKNVIIALTDDVDMVSKRTMRKPTRESLATPAHGRLSMAPGRLKSLREEIVETLY